MKTRPKVGLSILPEGDLRVAQLPLFADGLVEAIEWTLDAEFEGGVPDWVDALLDHYAAAGALYAHGVQFSPLSGVFEARQSRWLERARGALGKPVPACERALRLHDGARAGQGHAAAGAVRCGCGGDRA